MVDSFGEMGESFVCLGRETVFLRGVSSRGISVSRICSSMQSPPACSANSSSESFSSAGSSLELLLFSLGLGVGWASSALKIWMLVNEWSSLGRPVLELCVI